MSKGKSSSLYVGAFVKIDGNATDREGLAKNACPVSVNLHVRLMQVLPSGPGCTGGVL